MDIASLLKVGSRADKGKTFLCLPYSPLSKVNEILENYNFSKRRGVRIVPTANFLSISICSLKSRKVGGPTSYTFFICKFKRNVCCKEPPPPRASK